MHLDWWTIALQTINFTVLVFLLHRFLYKPLSRLTDARKADVRRQYDDAKAAEEKAQAHLAAIEAERAGINAERETLLKAAATAAEKAADARRQLAEREAQALIDGTRKTLAAEREQALDEAQRAALDLGSEFARRLLAEVPARFRTEAWMDQIDQSLTGLSKSELEALKGQLKDGGTLTVATASPLSPAAADALRNRLGRLLGNSVTIDFQVNPELIGGAELQFPAAVLRCSWQSAIATLRSEIETHASPH
jgi:F-type H+-transporting ATPase subunit b